MVRAVGVVGADVAVAVLVVVVVGIAVVIVDLQWRVRVVWGVVVAVNCGSGGGGGGGGRMHMDIFDFRWSSIFFGACLFNYSDTGLRNWTGDDFWDQSVHMIRPPLFRGGPSA